MCYYFQVGQPPHFFPDEPPFLEPPQDTVVIAKAKISNRNAIFDLIFKI